MRFYQTFFLYMMCVQVFMFGFTMWVHGQAKPRDEDSVNSSVDLRVSRHIAVSLMACARPAALNLSLASLERASARYAARWGEVVPVYVSMDCWHDGTDMEGLVGAWNSSKFLVYAVWFKEAREARDAQWADERVARHWLQSVGALFNAGYHYVVHLEEDHAVAWNFFDDLVVLLGWASYAACYNMGCGGDCWGSISGNEGHVTWMEAGNMGVVYSRQFWDRFLQADVRERFCGMRGNWDINVHILQSEGKLPVPCATYAMPRVGHMLNVGSARSGVESQGLPVISLKDSGSGGKRLVDIGRARYALEGYEQGPPLPVEVKAQCMALLGPDLKERVLARLKQEKRVEGRECASGFMALGKPEDAFAGWKKRDAARKIVVMSPYDCEVDMLLFKLEEMGPWIDHFVIVESSVSNSNIARSMCFDKAQVAESAHAPKIIYRESHESAPNFNYWEQEVYVKNQLGLPLVALGLSEDDLVVMMDMDEIIAGKYLKILKYYDHPQGHTAFKISLRWSYYGFEWVNPEPTTVSAVVSWREFRTTCDLKANAVRFNLCGLTGGGVLAMIGWHCSWCFADTGQFIRKIERSSKLEDNQEKFKNLNFLQEQRNKGLWFVDSMPNACFKNGHLLSK